MPTPTSKTSTEVAPPVPSATEYIVKTPGTCGGEARIAETRIKVKHVFIWVEQMGMTPAQIVVEYPHLTMAQVHAALTYYWSHQDEIHQDIENEEKLVAELRSNAGPSKILAKLAEQDAADDPISPRCVLPQSEAE
ncbi:MAG TPA: DUF433 domain-containing protein [Pirellulales bacterium]|nr:DUF433 domain-containing protein [Pirellulales bacterium]